MATVTRSVTRVPIQQAPPQRKPAAPTAAALSLPTELSKVVDDINAYSFLIHGRRKIGKTSCSTAEKGVLLLTFDPLQISRPLLQRHVKTWTEMLQYLDMLEAAAKAGRYPYPRVVVDGGGIWTRRAETYIAKKYYQLDSFQDIDAHGEEWGRIQQELENAVVRLLALPGGCWFVCHSEWKEVKTRRGEKIEVLNPALSNKRADNVLVGMTDVQAAYDYDGSERILVIQGDERITAGHRIDGHFLTPSGAFVQEIPMGGDEYEAWDNLQKAFHNEQPFINLIERDQIKARQAKVAPKRAILPTNNGK